MGPDLTESLRTAACPACGASLRPDAPWCTLCYADLRPKPAPEPHPPVPGTPPPTAAYGVPAGDPLTQPLLDFLPPVTPSVTTPLAAPVLTPDAPAGAATWPCTRCATANPLSAPVCGACGAPFLAALKDQAKPLLVLPLVGDLGRLSRGQRFGVALGAVAVLLVPLALVTLLLTKSPPASTGTTPGGQATVSTAP
ncbi:MAG: hypothetical protein WCD35_18900 [Mycobacteriales bacterium]